MEENQEQQYIVYEVASERYALEISEVHEIIKLQKITTVHNTKPYLEGVINLRGKIVPVVNLHKRLGLTPFEASKSSRIIVVESSGEMIGVLVDLVSQVVEFQGIQPAHEAVGTIESTFFEGLGLYESDVVGLLKLDRVLYE